MLEPVELLKNSAEVLGFDLSEEQIGQFVEYQTLLLDWNQKMNLTAITEPREIMTKHFIDSITPLCYREIHEGETWIDVGTGAGFPGIPLKIMRPGGKAVLLDSLQKRIRFLQEVVAQLSLEGVSCIHTRAEDAARNPLYREQADICFARAVARLRVLCEYCLPFVRIGGVLIAYKGPGVREEIEEAQDVLESLGGGVMRVETVNLPYSELSHRLVFIDKIKETVSVYPSRSNKKKKSPIK